MYTKCIFCRAGLGENRVLQHFPWGRKLSFDPDKGRLWVICLRCRRWNLTPIEERWEAIEECEALFSRTKLSISTDNIALALCADLQLVRIGRPLRPEFAAWRYGNVMRARFRQINLVLAAQLGGIGVAGTVGLLTGLWHPLVPAALACTGLYGYARLTHRAIEESVFTRLDTDGGPPLVIRIRHLRSLTLTATDGNGWGLAVPHDSGVTTIGGSAAIELMSRVLFACNGAIGSDRLVKAAVSELESAGDPLSLMTELARRSDIRRAFSLRSDGGQRLTEMGLLDAESLALEMACNEEVERVAAAGELRELERAWQQAEELAAIADDLLIPKDFQDLIARYRR